MAVTVLASAKGAPGTTTTTLGLGLTWPRPVLICELDTTGSSSIAAGYFRGQTPQSHSMVELAFAHRQGHLAEAVAQLALPLPGSDYAQVITGFRTSAQAAGAHQFWTALAEVLASLYAGGVDVLVDAGRLAHVNALAPVLNLADLTLLVTTSDLPSLNGARSRSISMREERGLKWMEGENLGMLLVGDHRPYSRREAMSAVGLPAIATIAWDPAAAHVLSHGYPMRRGRRARAAATDPFGGAGNSVAQLVTRRKFSHSSLARSLRAAGGAIRSAIKDRHGVAADTDTTSLKGASR